MNKDFSSGTDSMLLEINKSTSELLKEFGIRLRKERKRLNMTQVAFSRAVGLGTAAQHRYETGHGKPDLAYLLRIKEIGVDWYWVVSGHRELVERNCQQATLLEMFDKVSPLDRLAVLRMVTAFAGELHLPPAALNAEMFAEIILDYVHVTPTNDVRSYALEIALTLPLDFQKVIDDRGPI